MRLTPIRLAKRNLVEGYHNKSLFYSIFFPVIFLFVAMKIIEINTVSLHALVGLAFIFSSLDDALLSPSRERDNGTLVKLFLSPISRWSITGGRVISSLLLGVPKATLALPILFQSMNEVNPFNLLFYYILISLIIMLTVLVGLTFTALCRDSILSVLLALSVILLFAVPSAMPALQDNSNTEAGIDYNDYNPFWLSYRAFEKFINISELGTLEQELLVISPVFAWIVALYLIANVGIRRKIA